METPSFGRTAQSAYEVMTLLWGGFSTCNHIEVYCKSQENIFFTFALQQMWRTSSRDQFNSTKNGVFFFQSKKKNLKIILECRLLKLRLQNTNHFVPPSCSKWDLTWRTWWPTALTPFNGNTCILQVGFVQSIASFFFFLRLNCDSNTLTDTGLRPFHIVTVFCWFCLHSATRAHCAHCSSCVVSAVPLSVFSAQVCCAHRLCVSAACLCCIPSSQTSGLGYGWHGGKAEARKKKTKQSWRLIDKQLAAFESGVR